MFQFHIAFAVGMLALAGGTTLYIWSQRNQGIGSGLAKVVGGFIILFSIPSLFCTMYSGFRSWQDGYFGAMEIVTAPQPMMMPPMPGQPMNSPENGKPEMHQHKHMMNH